MLFPHAKNTKFTIKYLDDSGDKVNIMEQEDMDAAQDCLKGQSNIQFFVDIPETPGESKSFKMTPLEKENTPKPQQQPSGNLNRPLQPVHNPANPMQMSQIQPPKDHLVKFSQDLVKDNDEVDGVSLEASDHEDVQESGNVPVVANSHQTVFSEPSRSGN